MEDNKIVKIVACVLVILVIIAAIGLIAKFTGGFTSDFRTFYVTVGETDIMTVGNGYAVAQDQPLQVDVKYIFDSEENTKNGYSVKVVPNALDGTDFDFTLDGDVYSYHAEKDLSNGFIIEKDKTSFTLTPKGGTLTEILQGVYPDSIVGDCSNAAYEDMFTLIVTSYNGETSVKINFALSGKVSGVILDPEVLVF